jgi:hypothetical protein
VIWVWLVGGEGAEAQRGYGWFGEMEASVRRGMARVVVRLVSVVRVRDARGAARVRNAIVFDQVFRKGQM